MRVDHQVPEDLMVFKGNLARQVLLEPQVKRVHKEPVVPLVNQAGMAMTVNQVLLEILEKTVQ